MGNSPSWSGQALATGTAWAGLFLIHHRQISHWHDGEGVFVSKSPLTSSSSDRAARDDESHVQQPRRSCSAFRTQQQHISTTPHRNTANPMRAEDTHTNTAPMAGIAARRQHDRVPVKDASSRSSVFLRWFLLTIGGPGSEVCREVSHRLRRFMGRLSAGRGRLLERFNLSVSV